MLVTVQRGLSVRLSRGIATLQAQAHCFFISLEVVGPHYGSYGFPQLVAVCGLVGRLSGGYSGDYGRTPVHY